MHVHLECDIVNLWFLLPHMNGSLYVKKIWVKKSSSFDAAHEFDIEYYRSMLASARVDTMQFLREIAFKFKKDLKREKNRKGLRRSIKVVQ